MIIVIGVQVEWMILLSL